MSIINKLKLLLIRINYTKPEININVGIHRLGYVIEFTDDNPFCISEHRIISGVDLKDSLTVGMHISECTEFTFLENTYRL